MIITCEACNTSFILDDKMLKPTGSKVRCSICTAVFTAFPPQAPTMVTPAEPDPPATAEAVEAPSPETDVLAEDDDSLRAEADDIDFGLDDEPEEGLSAIEIEDALSDTLDEDLAEIAFESTAEPDLALEPNAADEADVAILANLDDDEMDLDLSPGRADEDGAATVIADLDDDALNISLEDHAGGVDTGIADLDLEDLDLDVPLQTGGDQESNATILADLDDDSLDLVGDFSLEAEDSTGLADASDDGLPGSLDDIDDLHLTLDTEQGGGALPADVTAAEADGPSLDELSLDFDLETDDAVAETASPPDKGKGAEDELDLGDEGGGQAATETEMTAFEDDLDLSNLESLLKEDDEIGEDSVTMVIDEDQELTLDLDDDILAPEAASGEEPGEALEDLEFNLDGDTKVESLDLDLSDEADQEIDLSEIEKMLEEPETGRAKLSSAPEQDLDLDIEASLETEKWMSDASDDGQLVMDEELDLSELEQVLEDVDTDATDDTLEDPELELELGDVQIPGRPAEPVTTDNRLDFDLSDFEDTAPPKSGDESSFESVDMDLEFEVEADDRKEQALEDEGLETTVVAPEPKPEKAKKEPSKSAGMVKAAARPKPVKKGVSKSLVFLLIVIILGGGGYGTYYLLERNGIDIPFLNDYLKPAVNDPGNLKLTTFDVNSKFVDNANVGRLFVISGMVKNGYAENRGMITLMGKIFSTGKVAVHQEQVYCGNVMSDLELANLEWDTIQARLSNRLGDNRSNVRIEPGNSIPFMVVFSGLPDDLEEFTIEVTGSTPLK